MRSLFSRIIFFLILSLSIHSCGQQTKHQSTSETTGKEVSKTAVSLISPEALNEANDDIQLIDVRTPEEFASGHLEHAVNINFFDEDFTTRIDALDKNREIYLYCAKGGRSAKAARKIDKMGFTKIYDLEGGIIAWKQKNLKIVD